MSRALESFTGLLGKCSVLVPHSPDAHQLQPPTPVLFLQEILSACWAFDLQERPSFSLLMDMLEKLPKLNRRLSHPGHFWKSAE